MMTEEWRPAHGLIGYEVSTLGAVRRTGRPRYGKAAAIHGIKPRPDRRGNMLVSPFVNGKQRPVTLKTLVFRTFIGSVGPREKIIHIDGDKRNCSVANLARGNHGHQLMSPGDKLGRWTLIEIAGKDKFGNPKWRCRCDCGSSRSVNAHHLKSGRSRSCGCIFGDIRDAQRGDGHPGWNGGMTNRGSLAWSKHRLYSLNAIAKAAGEPPIAASPEDVRSLWQQSGAKCAVCGQSDDGNARSLSIDHDHATGCLRGVLCGRCNSAIGLAGDSPERLRKLAEYLESFCGKVRAS